MHGEENGLRLAGYGEFFESLFALRSIGGTNNGGLEARMREGGRWREERQQEEGGTLPGPAFSKSDVISTHNGKRTQRRRRGWLLCSRLNLAAMTDGGVREMDRDLCSDAAWEKRDNKLETGSLALTRRRRFPPL